MGGGPKRPKPQPLLTPQEVRSHYVQWPVGLVVKILDTEVLNGKAKDQKAVTLESHWMQSLEHRTSRRNAVFGPRSRVSKGFRYRHTNFLALGEGEKMRLRLLKPIVVLEVGPTPQDAQVSSFIQTVNGLRTTVSVPHVAIKGLETA